MEETKTVKKSTAKGGLPNIKGRWKLTYTPINKLKEFGGRGLSSYNNPRTGQKIPLIDLASRREISQYMVDRLSKILNPQVPQDLVYIEWLIHHPNVVVEGYDEFPEIYKQRKNNNSQIKLIALDYQEMTEIEDEEYIDKLVGRLSLDGGSQAIGLEKLKIVLASLNMTYRDARYISDPKKEKSFLRKTLKNYVKGSIKQAELVQAKLDDIDNLKNEYYVTEMARLGILKFESGMWKYHGKPLAVSVPKIAHIWSTEQATKEEMIRELEAALIEELR